MTRRSVLFWGSAPAVAVALAAGMVALLPYEALELTTSAERWQAWLLTVWTAGVLCLLFGCAALLGQGAVGFREVAEAGSVTRALEAKREARWARSGGFQGNFAWWLVATGGSLIAIYFVGWTLLG